MDNRINLVSVVGPTASGKTKLAVAIAQQLNGEIISADSMQIYRDMQIATAKPDEEERGGIPHHLMDFVNPNETYSVAMFVNDAKRCIEDIHSRGKLPIIAGGTGLYVDSLLNNIHFTEEERSSELTQALWALYEETGVDGLLAKLREFDPASAERLQEQRNPKRIIRAIELYQTTGVTMTEQLRRSRSTPSPYHAVKLGLNFRDREKLYARINQRVDNMLEQGLLEETEAVLRQPLSETSVKAIGYKELAPYFQSGAQLSDCVEKLKRETRRYAKRQITWFKRDKEINWLYADEYHSFEEIYNTAIQIIKEGLLYG